MYVVTDLVGSIVWFQPRSNLVGTSHAQGPNDGVTFTIIFDGQAHYDAVGHPSVASQQVAHTDPRQGQTRR